MKKILAIALCVILVLSFAACKGNDKDYSVDGADRAGVFYDKYFDYVMSSGKGQVIDGNLCGAAVLRVLDFSGDGIKEMIVGYSSQQNGVMDSIMVCGFDHGYAELLNEKIEAKSSDDAKGNALYLYTDEGNVSYIVKGDNMSESRSYYSYQQADAEGKPLYQFAEVFKTDGKDLNGTYEKIEIMGNENAEAVIEENAAIYESLKMQKSEK